MKINKRIVTKTVLMSKASAYRKVILSLVVFVSVFYFHSWADRQHELGFPLGVALSSANPAGVVEKGAGAPALNSIDINSASSESLISLPGIGPKLADEIIKDREKTGHYQEPNDLLRVKGIGPKKLEKLIPFLRFDSHGK